MTRSFMKCDKCGGLAVIGMPEHRLNLCADHFLEWVPTMVQRTIERHALLTPQERVLVAVSGGKDSLSLWDILTRLGYQTAGVYINLGITHEGYSDVSEERARAFADAHGLALQVIHLRETYGQGIPELTAARRRDRPCSLCGQVKRHLMNRAAYEGGYAAIATGHNLDDEAAILLQNTLHWQAHYLRRQAPLLPEAHPRLARKVKPLVYLYEREVAAYALVRGLDFVEDECPYAVDAKTIFYKGLLNQLEERSRGAKQAFYREFLRAKEEGLFGADPDAVTSAEEYATCARCGQPTMAGELCAFCRLWEERP